MCVSTCEVTWATDFRLLVVTMQFYWLVAVSSELPAFGCFDFSAVWGKKNILWPLLHFSWGEKDAVGKPWILCSVTGGALRLSSPVFVQRELCDRLTYLFFPSLNCFVFFIALVLQPQSIKGIGQSKKHWEKNNSIVDFFPPPFDLHADISQLSAEAR